MRAATRFPLTVAVILAAACSPDQIDPTAPSEALTASREASHAHYSLNVELRGVPDAEGELKFRQPVDADVIAYLDTRVEHLAPNTAYRLQRAADSPDGLCTSEAWLTLGQLATPQVLTTNAEGKGQAQFSRNLAASLGLTFDIRFRIIEAASGVEVLRSGCYQFTVRQ